MASTVTYVSKTTNSVTMEGRHTDTGGSRIYFDYKEITSSNWLNRAMILGAYGEYKQYTYTSLLESTAYDFRVRIQNGSTLAWLSTSPTVSVTTTSPADTTSPALSFATPTGSNVTSNSIYAYASATDNVALSYFRFSIDGVSKNTVYVSGTSANANYTFTGLTGGVSYNLAVRAVDASGNFTETTRAVSTLSGRPNIWLWTTANDTNGNKISGANYRTGNTEWNDFTGRINEFRVYKGFTAVSFTQALYGSNFTATMFNQAKNAIGAMNATGISDRSAGQDVLASYFNTMKTKLNEL